MPPLVGFDSNILIYTELEARSEKGLHARAVLERLSARGVVPVQSLLEFVTVVRKRRPERTDAAIAKASVWATVFRTQATSELVMGAASRLVSRHQLQVWDAVILAATHEAGASVLLSEDMQDGAVLGGVRILNPFATDLDGLMLRLGPA